MRLTCLNLHATHVAEDVKAVAPLTRLTLQDLTDAQVAGDMEAMAPLT